MVSVFGVGATGKANCRPNTFNLWPDARIHHITVRSNGWQNPTGPGYRIGPGALRATGGCSARWGALLAMLWDSGAQLLRMDHKNLPGAHHQGRTRSQMRVSNDKGPQDIMVLMIEGPNFLEYQKRAQTRHRTSRGASRGSGASLRNGAGGKPSVGQRRLVLIPLRISSWKSLAGPRALNLKTAKCYIQQNRLTEKQQSTRAHQPACGVRVLNLHNLPPGSSCIHREAAGSAMKASRRRTNGTMLTRCCCRCRCDGVIRFSRSSPPVDASTSLSDSSRARGSLFASCNCWTWV